ncbi:XdhC family protein [Aquimarina sediminis]|uniref:XdhC family protein n=1 Tax=Aquimarina sediminis TaxID=2070536 RepID=UPI000CA04E16|nr:XdhC/CoxI family protein [Aquimarina sediminis]
MKFWKQILQKLKENKKVCLLTVVQHYGSSPGRKGFKMFVSEDDFIYGSIGGGIMEFNLIEEAKILLKQKTQSICIKKQIHKGKIEQGSGMICSGEQTVVFHPLCNQNILLIERIVTSLGNNKKGVLTLSSNAIKFEQNLMNSKYQFDLYDFENWCFKEQLGNAETIYIVGGGHVGLAVSKLFNMLNFYVVVFDDRDNLNTFEDNEFANEKHTINYSKISEYIPPGSDSYVAIMTNKYTDDKLVLSTLIENQYRFLGVLGSKAKLETMYKVLEEQDGISREKLSKIKAPIGVPISSQTPEEIAVSIAAQIIEIKNRV